MIWKLIFVPVILVCAALGFPALEKSRRVNAYGWLAPEMDAHWNRFFRWTDFNHDAKNVMSEWVRLDPQRAGKIFSFAVIVSFLIGALM